MNQRPQEQRASPTPDMDEEAAVRHEILLDELRGSMCHRRAKSSPQSATGTFALGVSREQQWRGEDAAAEEGGEESCMEEEEVALQDIEEVRDIADVDAQEHIEEPVAESEASRFEINIQEDAHLSDEEPSFKRKRRRRRMCCCPWCVFLLSMHRLPGVLAA